MVGSQGDDTVITQGESRWQQPTSNRDTQYGSLNAQVNYAENLLCSGKSRYQTNLRFGLRMSVVNNKVTPGKSLGLRKSLAYSTVAY